jgi:hypothetical protein
MTGDVYAELGGHSNTKLKVNLADAFHKADGLLKSFKATQDYTDPMEAVFEMLFLIITLLCVMLAPKSEK